MTPWPPGPPRWGMNYARPQIPTDSFELPTRKAPDPPKAKNPPVRNLPPKPKVSKPPKKATPRVRPEKHCPEPTPAQAEAKRQQQLVYEQQRNQLPDRKERRRLLDRERRRKAKAMGLCKDCSNAAIPNQSRCPTCAEKHRKSKRHSRVKHRAIAEQRAKTAE